jgi:hypothetical protein
MAEERVNKARGERIERLMTRQNCGVSHLARLVDVDRKAVYGWKAGKPIDPAYFERLAVALETTQRYIETGDGDSHYPRGLPPLLLLKQMAAEREAEGS